MALGRPLLGWIHSSGCGWLSLTMFQSVLHILWARIMLEAVPPTMSLAASASSHQLQLVDGTIIAGTHYF